MLLIKLKSKYGSEVVKVLAVTVNKIKNHFSIEFAPNADTTKLERAGFEPGFDDLLLSKEDFADHVESIQNVG